MSEIKFKNALKQYYRSVVSKSYSSQEKARIEAAKISKKLFDFNKFELIGTENLPLEKGIVLNTIDSISDKNGVAIIQEGDAEGKNGEYDNNYVWIFKMKDGLIFSVREYNSDILVATKLYDYRLVPSE